MVTEAEQRASTSEQHGKPVVRIDLALLFDAYLLVVQQASGDLGTLVETQRAYSGPVRSIFLLTLFEAGNNHSLATNLWVLRPPPEPRSKQAIFLVNGLDHRPWFTEEGSIGEDQSKVG